MKLTGDKVLVKQVAATDVQVGMIAIPQVGTRVPTIGVVEGTGPKVKDVFRGDKVLWSKHQAVTTVHLADTPNIESQVRVILRERDILAILG